MFASEFNLLEGCELANIDEGNDACCKVGVDRVNRLVILSLFNQVEFQYKKVGAVLFSSFRLTKM